MPANGLALAVRVSGQEDFVGFFGKLGKLLDDFLSPLGDLVMRNEAGRYIDSLFIGLWKIADVAHRRADYKITRRTNFFQILLNCLRLGWRLYDYQVHICQTGATTFVARPERTVILFVSTMIRASDIP